MTWTLVLIAFLAGGVIAFSQIIKINKIVLRSGAKILSGTKGMTSTDSKAIIKAFIIAFSALIGAFLVIALIFYLGNTKNFHVYFFPDGFPANTQG
jgi:hypothetical protein